MHASHFPSRVSILGLFCCLAVWFCLGCGSTESGSTTTASGSHTVGPQRLLGAVIRGTRQDFAAGTGAGPKGFEGCFIPRFSGTLDLDALRTLAAVYRRPGGQQFVAQALNRRAAPVADRCGGRAFVPELIAASRAFHLGRIRDSAQIRRLGLVYGPFIGVHCPSPATTGCDSVGFDLVLRHRASSVRAWIGGSRVPLVTPGPVPHATGAAGRDWGGYLHRAGLSREGAALYVAPTGHAAGRWAGSPPVYASVRVTAVFPDRGQVTATLRHVFLSPAFG